MPTNQKETNMFDLLRILQDPPANTAAFRYGVRCETFVGRIKDPIGGLFDSAELRAARSAWQQMNGTYSARSARDAHSAGMAVSYCDYLESSALETFGYFDTRGDAGTGHEMLTRTLADALRGNDGI